MDNIPERQPTYEELQDQVSQLQDQVRQLQQAPQDSVAGEPSGGEEMASRKTVAARSVGRVATTRRSPKGPARREHDRRSLTVVPENTSHPVGVGPWVTGSEGRRRAIRNRLEAMREDGMLAFPIPAKDGNEDA